MNLTKISFVSAVGAITLLMALISGTALASDSDECLIAESNARAGQEAFGIIFDRAEVFLKNNEIDYDLYGKKRFFQEQANYGTRYSERYCSDVYGGCGADKFEIDVSLNQSEKDYPIVTITPQSGAKNTRFGYIIIGKLSGVISHKECSGTEFINGHVWRAHVWENQIAGNINKTGYVQTSLSLVGTTVHRGYYGALPSYEDRTLVVRIDDFGNGPNLERFNDILEDMPGSGVVRKYD